MTISPGALCFIVRSDKEYLLGRVVDVLSAAVQVPEHNGDLMHRIDAPWLRSGWPGFHCYAAPSQLRPITPPGTTSTRRTSEPAPA